MNFRTIIPALALCLGLASCSTQKSNLPYFEDIITVEQGELPQMPYTAKIQPDDELFISITSEQPLATAAYNVPFSNPAKADQFTQNTAPRILTYRVDSKGDIDMPVLGKVHVAGMTVEQLRNYLVEKVSKDVADPMVTVSLVNFTVSVAGEVKTPMIVRVDGNRITVLEALAAAGDLTEYGERSNVLVVREVEGKREYAHLDLNSSETLLSPYYYLQPNDYVYVSPNNIRQANSKYNQNNAFKLSVISTIVSACSVVASLIIALGVK